MSSTSIDSDPLGSAFNSGTAPVTQKKSKDKCTVFSTPVIIYLVIAGLSLLLTLGAPMGVSAKVGSLISGLFTSLIFLAILMTLSYYCHKTATWVVFLVLFLFPFILFLIMFIVALAIDATILDILFHSKTSSPSSA